jgi:hypothetical protein
MYASWGMLRKGASSWDYRLAKYRIVMRVFIAVTIDPGLSL